MSMHFSWDTYVAPNEHIQKEFGISEKYTQAILLATIIGSGFVAFFVLYAGILVGLLGLLYWWYMKHAKQYCFTNKRALFVDTFIGITSTSIDYTQITDIEIEQSFFDQIGGWGTLIINTAGTHVPEIRLSFIDSPLQIKQALDSIRDSSR